MKAINLLLLAMIIGIELFLGIVVARTIFYPPLGLDGVSTISNSFSSGIIMAKIFFNLAAVVVVVSVLNFIYELVSRTHSSNFKLKLAKILFASVNLVLALLFMFYYTQPMIAIQELILQGKESIEAIYSDTFTSLHKQSEMLVKILVVLQVILFFLSFKSVKNEYNR